MDEGAIVEKVRRAKNYLKTHQYDAAKDAFLDAAELALTISKTTNDPKFKAIAGEMVEFAKDAKQRQELREMEADLPPTDLPQPSASTSSLKTLPEVKVAELEYSLREKTKIDVVMGYNTQSDHLWKPAELMNGIMMLTGGSGSGKTEWLRSLIIELTSRGYPTLVLDLHGDIETDIPSLELDYRGLVGVNPLELLSTSDVDGGPQPNINRLIKLLTDAVEDGFSPVQQAFLRSILNLCYESAGIRQDDPTSWDRPVPTFDFIRDVLMQPDEVLAPLSHLSLVQEILASNMATIAAVKNRLLPILEHPAFNAKTVIPINSAFDTPMRVDLKALQTVDMQFIVADTLLNHIFIKAQSMGHVNSNSEFDKFRLFIIIDEVKILSGNRRDRDDNFHILNRLATEARKYGIGLVVASQLINHYGRDIRANAATKLVLRPMDVQEARLNAKEMQVDFELLQDLRLPGQCYYRSSVSEEAIPLRLYPLKNRPLKSFVD